MRYSALLATTFLMSQTDALKPEVGRTLSPLTIADKGEIALTDKNRITYANWDSQERLTGKIRFVQVMGGSWAAKRMNQGFIDKIDQAEQTGRLPNDFYQATTIVDMRKCLPGTQGFVRGQLEYYKSQIPQACFVTDDEGVASKEWCLESKSSIMALNEKGEVLFAKDGALSEQEGEALLANILEEIDRLKG
jgi:YtfJ family uncharacterized protein